MICVKTSEKSDLLTIDKWGGPDIDPTKVEVLSAEGEELDLILRHVRGIPHTDHYLQVWFGDMAKFIYRALPGIPGYLPGKPKKHSAKLADAGHKEINRFLGKKVRVTLQIAED